MGKKKAQEINEIGIFIFNILNFEGNVYMCYFRPPASVPRLCTKYSDCIDFRILHAAIRHNDGICIDFPNLVKVKYA